MNSVIKQVDNGIESLSIGYTGIVGYLKDGYMTEPLYLGETGQPGLTGFGPGKSLLGAINEIPRSYAKVQSGSYQTTLLGVSSVETGTAYWEIHGGMVYLTLPALNGTSDDIYNCEMSNLPVEIDPSEDRQGALVLMDDGTGSGGVGAQPKIYAGYGDVEFNLPLYAHFGTGNSKGFNFSFTIVYKL